MGGVTSTATGDPWRWVHRVRGREVEWTGESGVGADAWALPRALRGHSRPGVNREYRDGQCRSLVVTQGARAESR